jgi:hypothetical protein
MAPPTVRQVDALAAALAPPHRRARRATRKLARAIAAEAARELQ